MPIQPWHGGAMARADHRIYTLLVTLGRRDGDGLPEKATGAAMICYASGNDEAEAVRETVQVLKVAELAPLEVESYGSLEDRLSEDQDIGTDEIKLMKQAKADNAVVVAQVTPFFD